MSARRFARGESAKPKKGREVIKGPSERLLNGPDHPYEGGHPDHDAAALAVHVARRILKRSRRAEPCIIEMTSYHLNAGKMEVGAFLPADDCEPVVFHLSEQERRVKQGGP